MIEAAGGVVLRDVDGHLEVLVVHRVRHQDWSLPKGKLDPGEDAPDAAVREVAEETGVTATLGPELPSTTYLAAAGPKRVRWYLMAPADGHPDRRPPDGEVDQASWWSTDEALRRLTYARDRDLLRTAVACSRA